MKGESATSTLRRHVLKNCSDPDLVKTNKHQGPAVRERRAYLHCLRIRRDDVGERSGDMRFGLSSTNVVPVVATSWVAADTKSGSGSSSDV